MFEWVKKVPFESIQKEISTNKPYGLRADILDNYEKYNLEPMSETNIYEEAITIYIKNRKKLYVDKKYQLPKISLRFKKYKIFVAKAWGNMSDSYLGGAYSDIILAKPFEICSETYLESGTFDDKETAIKHAKYLMTRFFRALFYLNKHSQNSTRSWGAIPIQDYKEPWWNLSIEEIEDKLFDKYSIPEHIRIFVKQKIQKRDETNIRNI